MSDKYNDKNQPEILSCSFCGKSEYDVPRLFSGVNCLICSECVKTANSIILEEEKLQRKKKNAKARPKTLITPHEIKDKLDQYVIGQDEAVTALSKAIRRSRSGLKDPRRPSGSFIFLGPSGVGKTSIATAITNELDLKVRFLNATINNKNGLLFKACRNNLKRRKNL